VLLGCVGTGAIRRTLLTRCPTFHSPRTPDILRQQDRAVWRNRGDVRERAADRRRGLTASE
jgi:hypothetical protein